MYVCVVVLNSFYLCNILVIKLFVLGLSILLFNDFYLL